MTFTDSIRGRHKKPVTTATGLSDPVKGRIQLDQGRKPAGSIKRT